MSYELMFQKAADLQQAGALNEAEKIYRQILQAAPNNADVLNMLGLIAQTRGLHQEACTYFFQAMQTAPHHFPLYFNAAISLIAEQKYVQAQEALAQVIKLKPDLKEAYFELGNISWQQNNLPAAADYFTQALQIDQNYREAQTNLAEVLGDVDLLERISPQNPDALYYLGRRAFNSRDYEKACTFLQQADQLSPSYEIKKLLGQSLLACNHSQEALKVFYQADNLFAHDADIAVLIADLEADQKNGKQAEKFYQKAIRTNPQSLKAHANYADFLVNAGRTLEALEEYRAAVLINPETPELSYNLAVILQKIGEYEQALDLMFFAYYKNPQNTSWMFNIAETLILYHHHEAKKAERIVQNWLQKMPQCIAAVHLNALFKNEKSPVETTYNQMLFDQFAPTYESTMQSIHYSVIEQIAEQLTPQDQKILDLGCGTGLLGAKISDSDRILDGVDFSSNMLAKAAEKKVYQNLIKDDILHYLQTRSRHYDAIVAADVFCYLADLAEVFKACAPAKLIFSVETDDTAQSAAIQSTGRYKHNPQHVEQLLQAAGYQKITRHPIVLRHENGTPVNGIIFAAQND